MKRTTVFMLILLMMFLLIVLFLTVQSEKTSAMTQDICRDNPIVYDCWPDFGCAVDPIFIKYVTEMAAELNLPDDNYRPCRLIIDTEHDGRYEVPYPLTYIEWAWPGLWGVTARDYVMAWRDTPRIVHTQVWLERHIPNHLPIIVEKSGWRDNDWRRGDVILPVAPGYPPPPSNILPPYP